MFVELRAASLSPTAAPVGRVREPETRRASACANNVLFTPAPAVSKNLFLLPPKNTVYTDFSSPSSSPRTIIAFNREAIMIIRLFFLLFFFETQAAIMTAERPISPAAPQKKKYSAVFFCICWTFCLMGRSKQSLTVQPKYPLITSQEVCLVRAKMLFLLVDCIGCVLYKKNNVPL